MAALAGRLARSAAAVALAGCGDLHGLEPSELPPLVSIHVRVTGDLDAVRQPSDTPPKLRATLVWGQPSLPDASCLPPFENPDHARVAEAGCGDPLGFVRGSFDTTPDEPIAADGTATIELFSLPDQLYGDMYAQIAYGSVVVYDDLNGSAFLDPFTFQDVVYGASFSSMAEPDTRIAFRHGEFDEGSAYYPRRGCEPPAEGYSQVSAGGFTLDQAVEAQARGELPAQDPAQCRRDPVNRELEVALRPPDELRAVGCFPFAYFFTPPEPFLPPGGDREVKMACTSIPDRGTGRSHGRIQLLITRTFDGACKFIQHEVLRGCQQDPLCEVPEWNVPAPSWWPCPPEESP